MFKIRFYHVVSVAIMFVLVIQKLPTFSAHIHSQLSDVLCLCRIVSMLLQTTDNIYKQKIIFSQNLILIRHEQH